MLIKTKNHCLFLLSFCFLALLSFSASKGEEIDVCFDCHGNIDIEDDMGRSLYVNRPKFLGSIHGKALNCTDCHVQLAGANEEGHAKEIQSPKCGRCHDDEQAEYNESIHAKLKTKGDEESPGCTSCHNHHYALSQPNPDSRLYRTNQAKICASCHENIKFMGERGKSDLANFVESYEHSIHGMGVSKAGLKVSAVCSDCHGSHRIVRVTESTSPACRKNIPKTCKKCHIGVYREYKNSVHGKAFFTGNLDAPVCTDCHGEHTIQRPGVESSPIYATHIPETCSRCHDDMALDNKYDLPSKRLSSYMGSYHGIALTLGDVRVANCASCHGVHNILPSSNPNSRIHPSNLQKTCGVCHPQAGQNFANAKIHITNLREENIGVLIVKRFYSLLIAILTLSFVSLITIDLIGHWKRRKTEAGAE